MSRAAASTADTGAALKTVGALVFVLAMAGVVLVLVSARPAPDPFDPRSGRADGTRGLVVTLGRLGIDVDVVRSAPSVGDDATVLVFDDRLSDDQRDGLLDFVEAGGRVVVADPASALHGGAGVDGGAVAIGDGVLATQRLDADAEANLGVGACTIDGLVELRGLVVPDGVLFPAGPDEPRCFARPRTDGDFSSFVIVRTVGSGTVVGLGDNEPFQNRWLRGADNAGLLVGLLGSPSPEQPAARVTVLVGDGTAQTIDDVGTGDDTLGDLVPTWAWMSLVLAGVAFVVFAVSRATRLGRVLHEPVAVDVEGSELVAATGNLMERAGHASTAAAAIRRRLHRDLARAHGLEPDVELERLDRIVVARSAGRLEPGVVEATLRSSVADEAGLVRLADRLDHIRRAALGPADDPAAATRSTSDDHRRPHDDDPSTGGRLVGAAHDHSTPMATEEATTS